MASFTLGDIELLGYSDPCEEPLDIPGSYQFFSGTSVAGLRKITSKFLYLKSDCTKKEVDTILPKISQQLKKTDDFFILRPKSFRIKLDNVSDYFQSRQVDVMVYEDALWDRLKTIFSEYMAAISTKITSEPFFEIPRKEDDATSNLEQDLFDLISDKTDIAKTDTTGKILVLSAPAGVGKTTLARQLTLKLANTIDSHKIIPTFIEALHWSKLKIEAIDDLWEIIQNSLKIFSPNISFSEKLFQHAIRKGYLVFIFDGFDELCSHRDSHFSAREVLNELSNIAEDAEAKAKILLTTRTSYWNSEIETSPKNINLFQLASFTKQQALSYFDKRFAKYPLKKDKARSLYNELIKANIPLSTGGPQLQFVNLPLCISLIADYIDNSDKDAFLTRSGRGLAYDLLIGLCKRDRGRHSLTTPPAVQMYAFEEIAVAFETLEGGSPIFGLDELELAGFNEKDLNGLIDHPLLQYKKGSKPHFTFSYAFLPSFLKASYVADLAITKKSAVTKETWKLMASEANGKGHIFDHLSIILAASSQKEICEYFSNLLTMVPKEYSDSKCFIFHIFKILTTISEKEIKRRSDTIFNYLCPKYANSRKIDNIRFLGNIEGLSIKDTSFENCSFIDCSFIKCLANGSTSFINCKFDGYLSFKEINSSDWAKVVLDKSCIISAESLDSWEIILSRPLSSVDDHISDAIKLALDKFWHFGMIKKTIRKNSWTQGSLGHSKYCTKLLDSMLQREIFSQNSNSDEQSGEYSLDDDAVLDIQKFMDNRQLSGKVLLVFNDLKRL